MSDAASPSAISLAHAEVLVVGGGPAGAAAAYWLARHGHAVTIIERRTFPRDKTCGDALTPRAVKQLEDMGLGSALESTIMAFCPPVSAMNGIIASLCAIDFWICFAVFVPPVKHTPAIFLF